ncbi:unnamed protein product, partial [Ascophyllum nodosum]
KVPALRSVPVPVEQHRVQPRRHPGPLSRTRCRRRDRVPPRAEGRRHGCSRACAAHAVLPPRLP